MMWIYAGHLPSALTPHEWVIEFRYPAPIGHVRLCLRSNHGADSFTHSEIFEQQCYKLPLRRAPSTILDLGANIGLSTIYFARHYPQSNLACVEPVQENLRFLHRNLELNGVRAEVIAAAVDSNDGVVTMERGQRDYAHKIAEPPSSQSSLFDVSSISIPSIQRRLGWSRISLIKMDIEGHEKVLFAQNCEWLHDVDAICLEYHHHFAEAELARIAGQFGFLGPQRLPGNIWYLSRELQCC
jgi:FkbM family methyltransferase